METWEFGGDSEMLLQYNGTAIPIFLSLKKAFWWMRGKWRLLVAEVRKMVWIGPSWLDFMSILCGGSQVVEHLSEVVRTAHIAVLVRNVQNKKCSGAHFYCGNRAVL